MKIVSKQKISTHGRTRNQYESPSETRRYVPKTKAGIGMYTFVVKDGGRTYSMTKHCSEQEADAFMQKFS